MRKTVAVPEVRLNESPYEKVGKSFYFYMLTDIIIQPQ